MCIFLLCHTITPTTLPSPLSLPTSKKKKKKTNYKSFACIVFLSCSTAFSSEHNFAFTFF
uniref:Uncharacterized protein n=1 Tax=Rhizophora mucronata TaxID=61149 RepID=A0A2P2N3Q6_RHIMU